MINHLNKDEEESLCNLAISWENLENESMERSHVLNFGPALLLATGRWEEAMNILCDVFFIEARAMAGLLDIQQADYSQALSLIPGIENKKCLDNFYTVFMRQKHILKVYPELTFQQMYNELQWIKGKVKVRIEESKIAFFSKGRFFLHQYREPQIIESHLIMTLSGHKSWVSSCAFSSDGKRIVSGSKDKTLKLWNAEKSNAITSLVGHSNCIRSCAFSPDGKRIVSGSWDKTLKLWDAETGIEIACLTGHMHYIKCCAFSPNGKRIISGSQDSTLILWDAETGEKRMNLIGHKSEVNSCAFSPDGKRIVSGSYDSTLKLWDTETGKELATLSGHTDNVNNCRFSPDGKRIFSGSYDSTLKIWDAESGKEIMNLSNHHSIISSFAFSPDMKWLVSASWDKNLIIWDIETGIEIARLVGHRSDVHSCAFSPDGKLIISGSRDKTIKIWDSEKENEILSLKGHNDWVHWCSFLPDGKKIVSISDDKTIKLWDVETGKIVAWFQTEQSIECCSIHANETAIVCGDKSGSLYFFKLDGLKIETPSVTGVRLFKKGKWVLGFRISNKWDNKITAVCPYCGERFPCSIPKDTSGNDPRLLSECPECKKNLKLNHFVVDNMGKWN